MKRFKANLNVEIEALRQEELQEKIENLCKLMRQINDIVLSVDVTDYYEVKYVND